MGIGYRWQCHTCRKRLYCDLMYSDFKYVIECPYYYATLEEARKIVLASKEVLDANCFGKIGSSWL